MQQLVKDTSEISDIITDTLTTFRDSVRIIIEAISIETRASIKLSSLAVSFSIIDLIDEIFNLYSYEWVIANRAIISLNEWISRIAYDQAIQIDKTINTFNDLTDLLIQRLGEQLDLIDLSVSDKYNERMFVIYGRIAEFSTAINAPPFYLEGIIQNARSFAMAIACSSGLSYYQFQADWADGVNRLLIRIGNSVSLYQQNPQWIKVDIENSLIRPLFEIAASKRQQELEQLSNFSNEIANLQYLASVYQIELDETKQSIENLYELRIAPVLKEITEAFDVWEEDTYDKKMDLVDKSFVQLFKDIVKVSYQVIKLIRLLDLPGDILLRVNKLSGYLRFDQEAKIGDVSTRDFRRRVPEWQTIVKKGTE